MNRKLKYILKHNCITVVIVLFLSLISLGLFGQPTTFEKSNGQNTTSYDDCIAFYKGLAKKHKQLIVLPYGLTDAGLPLQVVLYNTNQIFEPKKWQQNNTPVFFINNGIHPGEPDGIDASMLFIKDLLNKKISLPSTITIAIIPIYNIGGALNRNSSTRVNQNGPNEYGFRGNSQNLDLNRDFIKTDSKEAKIFHQIFQQLQPDLFLDTHVSDGADYQHTLTLLTTQHQKLLPNMGQLLHDSIEPAIYTQMKKQFNWDLVPYVNFEDSKPYEGWASFYDAPRYSTGYTALFNTIGFMSETHMLKPFSQRVKSTYDLLITLAHQTISFKQKIAQAKSNDNKNLLALKTYNTQNTIDSSRYDWVQFKGYEAHYKTSHVTGLQQLYYDKTKPIDTPIKFYNYLKPTATAAIPKYFIIPIGWHEVITRLQTNKIAMQFLTKDSIANVTQIKIKEYRSTATPYEKHHRNRLLQYDTTTKRIKLLKGTAIIPTQQMAKLFIMATLFPTSEDSYFVWNFFDAILQQKEGFSNYRWEPIAQEILANDANLKATFDNKKATDKKFAADADAQLDFIYKNSKWYEPAHLTYPVYLKY
jgi:hypothetical protein